VKKSPIDASYSSEWHHVWVEPAGRNTGWQGGEAAVSSAEENKALVRRFLEAHAKGDLDALEEMLAPDFVNHNLLPGQEPARTTREGYLQSTAEYHAAFSNSRYVIEKQVAEGDEVVTTFTASSTHDRGEWLGFVPTGKEFEAQLILVHRIVGGKIAEEWSEGSGLAELTQQRLEQEVRERERVEQELLAARSIQQAALPKEVPTLEDWQITPYYQPAREVGGDFYEFFELDDGRVGVGVGDATGKGMPAALAVIATCSMLRAIAQDSGYSPGEVLARVNKTLFARIPPNMFVTCFYAILEPKSGRLSYANAGHNLPCCRHEHAATTDLMARGMPLGLMEGMSYEEKETFLAPAEYVLFYTDGLVEAHNPQGEMFGTPRLRNLLSKRPEGGRYLSAALMEELRRFTGEGWEQEDDITLLTLERSPTRS
jgi:serine phosphatase RsbU (regulator of sigma subunit)/ketosteroid isomerase-like protein